MHRSRRQAVAIFYLIWGVFCREAHFSAAMDDSARATGGTAGFPLGRLAVVDKAMLTRVRSVHQRRASGTTSQEAVTEQAHQRRAAAARRMRRTRSTASPEQVEQDRQAKVQRMQDLRSGRRGAHTRPWHGAQVMLGFC